MFISPMIKKIIETALIEDIGTGDVTTGLIISPGKKGVARIIAREKGIIAGMYICREVFMITDESLVFEPKIDEGDQVNTDTVIAEISGLIQPVLSAERTALNFLQHLSGIATLTKKWADSITGYPVQLIDTRKTTPGLRQLEKYAVLTGGGRNHRMGLFGGILIKENHITAAGGIKKAVTKARQKGPVTLRVEVEVTSLEELKEALEAGADLIMLDNMDTETIKKAVSLNAGRSLLEASGNITYARLKEVAATGVNYISSGVLTHSAPALDLSLLIE